MLKKVLAFLVMLYAAASFAAVDVNKATAAELDSVKGVGPAISAKIVEERKNAPFKDWDDLVSRVKGIGEKSAAKLSEGGLTVNGAAFKGAAATSATAKKDTKAAAKDEKKAAPAAAASSSAAAKDEKAAAKEDKKAKKKADKEAKAEAKAEAKDAKADAAKPAASSAKPAASAKK